MVRLLTTIVLTSWLAGISHAQDERRHHFTAGVDLNYVDISGLPSWTEGFVGKLRYEDDGFALGRAFLDYEGRVLDTVGINVAAEAYDDDLGPTVDVTEAFLEWRPVPRSPNRYRLKVGAFYPRISLENNDPGWGSPYVLNSSTINTWVAEELRTFGAELSWSRRPASLGGRHELGLQFAVFKANDPTGALLAWKGWSAHDRQSRFSDKLPLPPLPQLESGGMFEAQEPWLEPFVELDDRIGWYLNAEWRADGRFLARYMRYDNRADPTVIAGGQYAWYTEFDHFGVQASLPGDVGLIAQWMYGTTVMGGPTDGIYPVDVEYDSKFVLLTRRIDKHRFSLRYDNFEVTQNDSTPEDNNPEDGLVWTASYRYAVSDRVSLATEWLSIKTHRCAWVYYGIAPTATERQFQLSIMLRFSR